MALKPKVRKVSEALRHRADLNARNMRACERWIVLAQKAGIDTLRDLKLDEELIQADMRAELGPGRWRIDLSTGAVTPFRQRKERPASDAGRT